MQNMWDVIHALIDDSGLAQADKDQAHGLTETHLAQHVGIAGTLGEHREKIKAHDDALKTLGGGQAAP